MTIETDLYSYLITSVGDDVDDRIHYYRAPQTTEGAAPPTPFVVYTLTNREFVTDLGGVTTHAVSTFQIDVCASSFMAAKAIAATIKTAMVDWSIPTARFHIEEEDFLDEAVEPAIPRVAQVWTFHHSA